MTGFLTQLSLTYTYNSSSCGISMLQTGTLPLVISKHAGQSLPVPNLLQDDVHRQRLLLSQCIQFRVKSLLLPHVQESAVACGALVYHFAAQRHHVALACIQLRQRDF